MNWKSEFAKHVVTHKKKLQNVLDSDDAFLKLFELNAKKCEALLVAFGGCDEALRDYTAAQDADGKKTAAKKLATAHKTLGEKGTSFFNSLKENYAKHASKAKITPHTNNLYGEYTGMALEIDNKAKAAPNEIAAMTAAAANAATPKAPARPTSGPPSGAAPGKTAGGQAPARPKDGPPVKKQ